MLYSVYPLYGMVNKMTVVRIANADDGAGGLTPSGSETVIYEDRDCRIALMSDEDQQQLFGNASRYRWKCLCPYSPDIQKSDFIRIAAGAYPYDLTGQTDYRVCWVRPQQDDRGGLHHTSFVMELEDQDTGV